MENNIGIEGETNNEIDIVVEPSSDIEIEDVTIGIIGPKGDKGDTGDTGPQGPQGPIGETGPAGRDGSDGIDGENGATFIPSIDAEGNISWTNDKGLPNPETKNVRGPQGIAGQDGTDGYSPSASVSKSGSVATISITDKNGTTTTTISDGTNGQNGQDGYTPQRTIDYWTNEDIATIQAYIDSKTIGLLTSNY